MKLKIMLLSFMAIGVANATPDLKNGKRVAEQVCASCHAADGNSMLASYPKLAGQHQQYIMAETKKIKEGKRTSGSAGAMTPMVQSISDDDIRDVSAFFTVQMPQAGETEGQDNVELGKKIYRAGLPDKKVPACMACHGPNGSGIPAGGTEINAYPRLAGQHSAYVETQLKAYADGSRPSPNSMMNDVAKRLNEEEIKAVSNYIQGLQ